jgi:hypothetical protein
MNETNPQCSIESNLLPKGRRFRAAHCLALAFLLVACAASAKVATGAEAEKETAQIPPVWVVADGETAERAEAGDPDAMLEIADGYRNLAESPDTGMGPEEREALFREAMDWMSRRAKAMADREGDVESVRKRAEAGDPAAQRNLAFRYSQGIDVEKDGKLSFEWMEKAAGQGDAKAMFNLANKYADGSGVAADAGKALEWYRKALAGWRELAGKDGLSKGDCRALVAIGRELLGEDGGMAVRDPALGMAYLRIAAGCRDAEALRVYGEQFAIGEAVEEDFDMALHCLQLARWYGDGEAGGIIERIHDIAWGRQFRELCAKADAGDPEAEKTVAEVTERWRASLLGDDGALLEARALTGHAPSQADLGVRYMAGNGVPQDKAKAAAWWRKAADRGEYRARFWLGTACERGDGVAKDDWKAVNLWQRSHAAGWPPATEKFLSLADEYRAKAEEGDASAQFFMGVHFENGYGGAQNPALAVEWYRKAAEQGHPGAQAFLGYALLAGEGTEKNAGEAVGWFRKAAEQGNPEGQQNLGRCLFYGEGCEENREEAVAWYRKSAEQGEAGSMFNLAATYLDGTGVPKDLGEAAHWLRRAAELGHAKAAALLETVLQEQAEAEKNKSATPKPDVDADSPAEPVLPTEGADE